MIRAILVIALIPLLTGCTAGLSIPAPTLTILDGSDPSFLQVSLKNNADRSIHVTYQGFRIVDAAGVASQVDGATILQFRSEAFPSLFELGPGESARGYISFGSFEGTPPYTLKYDYAGASGEVRLPSP
jgi:hypothetical protein